jgi:rod shape-determining protein MreC
LTKRTRDLIVSALLLLLPLLVLRSRLRDPHQVGAVDRFFLRATAPLEKAVGWIGRGSVHLWTRYVFLVGTEAENRRLHEENDKLHAQLAEQKHDIERVAELERLLALKSTLGARAVAARVVGAELSPYFRVVRIQLEAPEVKTGWPVVAPLGVVGRIDRVYGPGYADVLLACDPKSAIDVVDGRTQARGVLKGVPGQNRYRARIDYLLRTDEANEGDAVVTSGFGPFPRNLPVGRIVQLSRRDAGLFQEAEVEPAVDFSRLREVLVIRPESEHEEPAQP